MSQCVPDNRAACTTSGAESDVIMGESLRERVRKSLGSGVKVPWSSMPEVQAGSYLETMSEKQILLEELKFCVVTSEVAFNTELSDLVTLCKRSVSWADPLPAFNRRTIASTVERVKRSSDTFLSTLEKHWNKTPLLSIAAVSKQLCDLAPQLQHVVTYCTHLEDLRIVLRNASKSRPEVKELSFSKRMNVERTFLPLQHLKILRLLLQDIRSALMSATSHLENFHCKRALTDVTKLLEECHRTLTSLQGVQYVEDLDKLLEESLHGCDMDLSRKCLKEIKVHKNNTKLLTEQHYSNKTITFSDESRNIKSSLKRQKPLTVCKKQSGPFITAIEQNNNNVYKAKCVLLGCSDIFQSTRCNENLYTTVNNSGSNRHIQWLKNKVKRRSSDVEPLNCRNRSVLFSCSDNRYYEPVDVNSVKDDLKKSEGDSASYEKMELSECGSKSFISCYDIGCIDRGDYEPMHELLRRHHSSISPTTPNDPRRNALDLSKFPMFLQQNSNYDHTYEEMASCKDVPLYQAFKYRDVRENVYVEAEDHVYEDIDMDQDMQISRPAGSSQRVKWVDILEVISSGLLDKLDSSTIALQEAKYEIITSEASYFKSLIILEAIFISSPELKNTISEQHHAALFSNILQVKKCSERFLVELLDGWQDDLMLGYLCKSFSQFVESRAFQVYVDCCSNQIKIKKTLEFLKLTNPAFTRTLSQLEVDPVCQMFTLQSFLTLPMQRVTRLPMLVQAVLRRLPPDGSEHKAWKKLLVQLHEVANECNEAIGKAARTTSVQYPQLRTLHSKMSSLKWNTTSGEKRRQHSTIWNLFRIKR